MGRSSFATLENDQITSSDELLKLAAGKLKGTARRQFLAEVCERLCDGNARRAENRFGWERGVQECKLTELGKPLPDSGNRECSDFWGDCMKRW